jgi:hypothetical protein
VNSFNRSLCDPIAQRAIGLTSCLPSLPLAPGEKVGFNPRGKSIHLLEVNSAEKQVKGRTFDATGMPELASALLNALEPMDILTFTHRSFLGIGAHAHSRKRART